MSASNTTNTPGVVGNFFENDDTYQTSAEDSQVLTILRWGIVLAVVALVMICSVCLFSYMLHRRRRIATSASDDDQVTVADDDSIVQENIKGTCSV